MIALVILAGVVLWLAYRSDGTAPASTIRWKDAGDAYFWELGEGPDDIRGWIIKLNQKSVELTGRGIVVTSWFRYDMSYHRTLEAVDIRRLGAANALDPTPYTQSDVEALERFALDEGIPLTVQAEGTSNDHFHIGPIYSEGF
jgi:hypothetical protein